MDRKELLVTDLDRVFEPNECLSATGSNRVWRTLPYKTNAGSGVLLSALGSARPADISFDPKLKGWYKIYVQTLGLPNLRLQIKLSSDVTFEDLFGNGHSIYHVYESFWRCADMSDQSVVLSKKDFAGTHDAVLAGLRFVPMTEAEVEAYKRDACRTDTKRLYATHDMHYKLYSTYVQDPSDWLSVVLPYKNSDVEWLSLEEIRVFLNGPCPVDPDEAPFFRQGDRAIQQQLATLDYDRVLADCVRYGHEIGLKMSISLRMGSWGMGYPYDQCYFDVPFHNEHPELHCVDRNGDVISAMSYAYPEVRRFMIDMLVNAARSGCDAVTLIAHRGIPYVLFEKPIADAYFARYGEEPYDLPLDNPRLNAIHCEVMTGFFDEVRRALDAAYGKNRIRIQLRALASLQDNKRIGLDVEQLVAKGLVDDVIVYPQYFNELWNTEVLVYRPEKGEHRVDLTKYDAYVNGENETILRAHAYEDLPSYFKAIEAWNTLEKQYGTKLYFELMPRVMPIKDFKERAIALYEGGAERLALWDTYSRVRYNDLHALISKLGHKEELSTLPLEDTVQKEYRILAFGDMSFGRYKPHWGG